MAKSDAMPDALRRLGGGRWETKDGRFQIEPQSGTWVIVDTTQTNEFGLPLVRGPFASLGAAKDAIESARTEGPVQSPLAERIEQVRSEAPREPTKGKKSKATGSSTANAAVKPAPTVKAAPEPQTPPEPSWARNLQAGDRRRAKELITRLMALGIDDAEDVARAEVVEGEHALVRLALERRLRGAVDPTMEPWVAVRATVDAILSGEDPEVGVRWKLVDERGRRIEKLDLGG